MATLAPSREVEFAVEAGLLLRGGGRYAIFHASPPLGSTVCTSTSLALARLLLTTSGSKCGSHRAAP